MSADRPLVAKYLITATRVDQLPASEIEVAVVGRSNVGKSSLLNALANQRQLAKVSGTPGRTRQLNVFELAPGRWLVDLPGYGFAKVPASEQDRWKTMIEGYLLDRHQLAMVFVLVDAEIGPTKLDAQMLDWLRANELNHRIIATKYDRVKPSKLHNTSRRPGNCRLVRRRLTRLRLRFVMPRSSWRNYDGVS